MFDRRYISIFLSVVIMGSMVIFFATMPRVKSPNIELQELQIKKAKLSIELLKRNLSKDVLTVDDLGMIYGCVDTKIHNQNNKIKFPCVAVRGDSF